MTVFKCYMKILRQNIGLVIMYLAIFFSVAIVMQFAAGKSEDSLFETASIDLGVVNEDGGTLAQGLVDYLSGIHHVMLMDNNPEQLQENLFYRNVEYILQIPADFYETCMVNGQSLKVTKVPGSYSSFYVDQQISSYLNTIQTYLAAGFSQEKAIQAVKEETHEPVTKLTFDSGTSDTSPYTYYFRYIPYLFLGALCYTMGYILMAFKKGDIQKRMEASAISVRRQSVEGLLATGMIGVILWLIGFLGVTFMYGSRFWQSGLCVYYILNTFTMLIVALSLSYLIGMFITNSNLLSGVANLVSLAMCFLCGVFVPMDVMDKSVLKFAQFLPVYWYEQVNEILSRHHTLSPEFLGQVLIGIGIQLLFAAAFISLILVVSRYRKEG